MNNNKVIIRKEINLYGPALPIYSRCRKVTIQWMSASTCMCLTAFNYLVTIDWSLKQVTLPNLRHQQWRCNKDNCKVTILLFCCSSLSTDLSWPLTTQYHISSGASNEDYAKSPTRAFNQEKALVGDFSVILKLLVIFWNLRLIWSSNI